ncbi:hypothetical protein PGN35_022875 [Nodosilinea sp. PGN35]|uniref:hypothetical protein n=1 Tax=Nodosilinea sp. PGN35 TaxID=3020489 RepID=UPI0023B22B76|nr:hypothetical protein [Nodosilinea sp. TSF1-S3]MDF0364679.1 hypothetical protein [Nodosilinea sp. TSF1-S3]
MFIQHEKNCIVWGATLAIGAGVLLGGGAARVKTQTCNQPQALSRYCLSESPRVRVAHGMASGAFAGGGALLMIGLKKFAQR